MASHAVRPLVARFGIQVGTFASQRSAHAAALAARHAAADGEPRVESVSARGRTLWRAQLTGMSGAEAQNACAALARKRLPCLVLRPEGRQVASR